MTCCCASLRSAIGLARQGDRPRVLLRHVGRRLVVPRDDRREAVADPAQRPDAGKEGEQRRRRRGAEAEALALPDEARRSCSGSGWRTAPLVVLPMPTTGWTFQEPRKSTGRLMPVSQSIVVSKSLRKVRRTCTLSVGSGVDGSSTQEADRVSAPRSCRSFTWTEFCQLKPPNRSGVSKLSAVTRVRHVERQRVEQAAGQRAQQRVGQRVLGGVVGEAEPRRPGDVGPDRDRHGRQRHGREELLHAAVGQALAPVAAQRQRAPSREPLGVVERAGDLLGVLQRIDRVPPDDRRVARVVEVEREAGREIELLAVVPAEGESRSAADLPLLVEAHRCRSRTG